MLFFVLQYYKEVYKYINELGYRGSDWSLYVRAYDDKDLNDNDSFWIK